MDKIKNYNKKMEYRRFGKTEEKLSVITLGGMRFFEGFTPPRDMLPVKMIDQCLEITKLSFEAGINHIETAYAYQKSESCFGIVLNEIMKYPRQNYYLMTKGRAKTKSEMRKLVEEQLIALRTDYFDFYAWHGVNNEEEFSWAFDNGTVEELLKMKEEGIIKNVGFSTHGMRDIVYQSVSTDLFDFANIHYYYFNQQHQKTVDLMVEKDMGLFIISPNDKGGQLFNAPSKVKNITKPLTPIQWHTNNCLLNPHVHTLSFGMTEPSHIEEMKGIFFLSENKNEMIKTITHEMDAQWDIVYKQFDAYQFDEKSSVINIGNMYRIWCMWKFFDMQDFANYRYNMFKPDNSFIWSDYPNEKNIANINYEGIDIPKEINLIDILRELHEEFYDENKHK